MKSDWTGPARKNLLTMRNEGLTIIQHSLNNVSRNFTQHQESSDGPSIVQDAQSSKANELEDVEANESSHLVRGEDEEKSYSTTSQSTAEKRQHLENSTT